MLRFASSLIQTSFKRLRLRIVEGKKGVERTSALMYFLAYDSITKNHHPLSLDPNTAVGKQNRDALAREYHRLVILRNDSPDRNLSVVDLGCIYCGPINPTKRISSNFLTVPLKKASQSSSPIEYPNRPKPLLLLGNVLDNWGICPHPDWIKNFPLFLSERITTWPFIDLAIFILRDSGFQECQQFQETLEYLIDNRFSESLASYWKEQIAIEFHNKGFIKPKLWSSTEYHDAFKDDRWVESIRAVEHEEFASVNQMHLERRVLYLENLLRENNIPFESEFLL